MSDTPRFLDFDDVTIRSISVSDHDNNVYVVTSKTSGSQVLIDAADDAPAIHQLLATAAADSRAEPALQAIITTHRHWDHVRALAEMKTATGAPTTCGAPDEEAIDVEMDYVLDHGDQLSLGGIDLETIALRGHTPGAVALVLRPTAVGGGEAPAHIFVGDSLFPGGVGKTWSEEDFDSLIDDVEQRLFDRFADDTVIHPGHGKPTTLGAERPSLPEWRERRW